jgi:hypothetical protein
MEQTTKRIYYVSLALVFLVGAWIILQPLLGLLTLVSDDAFYYQVIARNIAQGKGVTFDGISLTNGFHPVYLGILIPLHIFFGQEPDLIIRSSSFINLAFFLIASYCLNRLGRRIASPVFGHIAAVAFLLNPWALLIIVNGVESGTYLFFLLLTFLAYLDFRENFTQRPPAQNPAMYQLILMYGLAILSRTEAILLFPCLVIDLYWQMNALARPARFTTRVMRIGPTVLLLLLGVNIIISPWVYWNLSQFGTLLQSSGATLYYHTHFDTSFLEARFWQLLWISTRSILMRTGLFSFQFVSLAVTFLLLGLILPGKYNLRTAWIGSKDRIFHVMVGLFGLGVLSFYAFILWRNQVWYLSVPVLYAAICFAIIACWFIDSNKTGVVRGNPQTPIYFLWAYLLVTYLVGFYYWQGIGYGKYPAILDGYRIAAWIRENTPEDARFATWSSGLIGYYSDRTVINLDGVVNNEILPYLKERNAYLYDLGALLEYLQFRQVTYITDLDVLPLTYTPETKEKFFETVFYFPSSNNTEQNIEIWAVKNHPQDK